MRAVVPVTVSPLSNVQITTVEGLTYLTGNIDFGATGINEVLQNVKYIVLTTIYSVPLDREFGIDASFVDKPTPRIPELIITQEVALKINLYEPRAKFRDISYDGDVLSGSLKVVITIEVDLTAPTGSNIPTPISTAIVPTPSSPSYVYQQQADGSLVPWVRGPKGDSGPIGPQGDQGVNAYTLSTADFTVPPVGGQATILVEDTSWVVVGQFLYVDTAGGGVGQTAALKVVAKTYNSVTLENISTSAATGPPGPQGPAGTAATIAVGTTSTNPPGTSATVNNSGSSSAAVFNFGIPQGTQGVPGATGATGSQGPQGIQGPTGATGSQGPTGSTGATGSQGPAGTAGSKWFNGTTDPVIVSGSNPGDYYLNTVSGQIFVLS